MKLSARKVQTAAPGRHVDGRGLMLVVKPTGAKSWVLRYQVGGRRHDLGLGPYPEISLAEARERALVERRKILAGRDPIGERKQRKRLTFEDAAEELIESKRPGWRNAKHAAQWSSTLRTYSYPVLGGLDVSTIDTPVVLDVLRPLWTAKPETASRLRQRIEAVLDYAAAMGARDGENPARWRGHLGNLLPKPTQARAVRHHAALEWRDVPVLMGELRASDWPGSRALAFVMLTAARSGEVRGMRWREVDLETAVWTVPAARIKAGKEHRVPLVPEAIALLGQPSDPEALVFESPTKPERPLSDVTLGAVLKRLGRGGVTVHGLRSTFRDWAGETTAHPREVIEAALAHRLKGKAEAAYARGDLFQKRRRLMEDWATHLQCGARVCVDKPFSERKLQHLSDDEVGAIVQYLHAAVASSRGALRMAPECIAADIELRARKFLREKEREQRARHPSKIARDLDTGLGRVRRCLEDLQALGPGSDRRALKRAAGRVEKLLRWLDDLDQDPRDALFIETIVDDAGRPVEDFPTIGPIIAALRGLDHPHTLGTADRTRLDRATSGLKELSGLIEVAAHMVEGPRSEKTSHRRSKARKVFLDQLADFFVAVTGCQPTFTRNPETQLTTNSPFAQFALIVLKIVDPEADRQSGTESDIQAAVGRKRRRHCVNDELVIGIYEDPRDRKLSRRRISQQ